VLENLSEKFVTALASIRGKGRLSPADIEEVSGEIRRVLLDADVALLVAEEFVSRIYDKSIAALGELRGSTNPSQEIFSIINNELVEILGGSSRRIRLAKKPPTVIMLAGLQGSGKTTLAGKLALFLREQGDTPLLVAADLQRPNAVNQLTVLAEAISLPIFAPSPGNGIGDPIEVARAGVEFAKSKLYNVVIIDTAGRLGVDQELMNEASAIRAAVNPDEVLLVVDAMIGQDAIRTAKAFDDGVGVDAIVLTKLDGDAKGGAALSIAKVLAKPILFTSTGEKLSDFDYFYPDRMASRILGQGDIQTLAQQANKVIDQGSAKRLEEKFLSGEDFTLEDFLEQLQAMQKMGSFSKILTMLPGANSGAMKKQIENLDDGELIRTQAIVQSMTPAERREPKILNGSRRARIAQGSGRTVSEVNKLVERFSSAQKAMKQMRTQGSMPAIPGLAPAPKVRPERAKKKSRSGNPAKRAAQEGG
jgi:signal recognition particle subunit SRP54